MNRTHLASFTDILGDEIEDSQVSQPLSLSPEVSQLDENVDVPDSTRSRAQKRPAKGTGQHGHFRSVDEIDAKYREVFSYPYFNLVQSNVIEDALYSDKSMVVCAPTGSGKTVVFEMAIVQLLMEMEDTRYTDDFKIIYMAPVKALCTERLTEWYPKFTKLGLLCIEVTGDTDVDFSQLKPYRIIITTPEKWDMVTRRWREHRQLVEVIKLFLIDEVHILNDETRGPVLEAVVSRMKTIESSAQSAHRIEQLQNQYQGTEICNKVSAPKIRFVAISATVSNPEDVAAWLGTAEKPAVYYKFGDESRPVKLKRVVEGYPCPEGTSIFKFDIILNYKLWPVIQKYHNGKPTLIFCNTRKSVTLTAETLSRELTVSFSPEQKAKLTAIASTIKNKKLQALVLSGVGCHHAGLLFEERTNIEMAFRNRDLPILITTTTLAMGVNLPAHLVIIKNTQQYVNGAYQEYSISTILQMVGRAGRPQYDTEATAVIMTRLCDKLRYQALVGGSEPLQSYLHKRLAENLNSEAALSTVNDVAQCVQWLRSTFLCVRAAKDPKRYLGLNQSAPQQLISKKIEELCVKAMNGLATSGLITMDEASCIESTEAGRLMSIFYLDLETMKHIMKISGTETLDRLLWVICESHELADMYLRVDERRCLNTLNRNNTAATIRFPMKGKISSRQMKLNCVIQAILGCLNIPDPSLHQEAMKIMRIADRVCKCLVAYVTRPALISQQPNFYSTVLNALILAKCIASHLWENSPFVSKQLKGIGPTFSTLLATAGKVNFMLLEESHPRDLERIMNKGPPAGNVLRKQISLLPKYQLTMNPIDEQSVTIQLVLLNQNFLSENIENLTAGGGHKSYVIVGDAENNLLLLTAFRDKELISVYDGTISHQITRKHRFEHKMFAHCISTSYVGIDAQCEYLFKSLEPIFPPTHSTTTDFNIKPANKQTIITDTFKERKRKNTTENDISQSKEKKKRGNAMIENFRFLKESFGKTSKELKIDLDKSAVMSDNILQELTQLENPVKSTGIIEKNGKSKELSINTDINKSSITDMDTEMIDSDEFINDDKFNDLLNKIESEISKGNLNSDIPHVNLGSTRAKEKVQNSFFIEPLSNTTIPKNQNRNIDSFVNSNTNKRMPKKVKSNYNFIDLLEKNIDLSDEEESDLKKNSGFSDTIKCQIEKYLEHTKLISEVPDKAITVLLQDHDSKIPVNENIDTSNPDIQTTDCIPNMDACKNNVHCQLIYKEKKKPKGNSSPNRNVDITKTVTGTKNDNTDFVAIIDNIDTIPIDISCHNLDIVTYNKIDNKTKSIESLNLIENYFNRDITNNITESNSMANTMDDCGLLHDQNHNDKIQLNTKSYFFDETTTEPNTIEYTNTIIPFQSDEQVNSGEHNTKVALSDMIVKPSHPRFNPEFSSESSQSSTSANYNHHSNYSNNSEKEQNTNIRKYSYSSTKTDVVNKNADVQIIRKTKIDLNITEIISRENKGNHEPKIIDINEEVILNTENMGVDFLPLEFEKNTQNKEILCPTIYQKGIGVHDQKVNANIKCMLDQKKYAQTPQQILASPLFQFKERLNHVELKANTDIKCALKEKNWANTLTLRNQFIPPLLQFNQQCKQMKQKVILDSKALTKKSDIQTSVSKTMLMPPLKHSKHYNQIELIPFIHVKRASVENNITPTTIAQTIFTPPPEFDDQCNKIGHAVYKPTTQVEEKEENDVEDLNLNQISSSSQKDNNRLGNILQKYSKLLRKNTTGNFSQNIAQSKIFEKDLTNSASEKPKRPFNITDINNLNNSLAINTEISKGNEYFTGMITETPNRENVAANSTIPKYKITFHESEPIRYCQNLSDSITSKDFVVNCEDPNVTENINSVNMSVDFSESKSPVDNNEELGPKEPKADFNIDQSMFNPKTLLQCLINDEPDDIVPPPPEFCDERDLEIHDDFTDSKECYETARWDCLNKINETEDGLFQDESHIELTPGKEIETWTLSENEESCESLPSPSNLKFGRSFTIMHSKKSYSSQFQSPSVTTIRQNLGKFYFCRKKKLLPKS